MGELALVVLLLVAAVTPVLLLRDLRTLPSPTPGVPRRSVSVVVPARDEEATLPALLASVAALTDPIHEVVVVDDDSRDATAALARAAGARVLPAGPPPTGWTGKAWACQTGAAAATGDLLLFLDADTTLAPHALAGLLQMHSTNGGLISVQPYHRVERAYEQLSAYFNVVALMASSAFSHGDQHRPMAFGPCLLTTRGDYEQAGGHEAVRGEILDDAALAVAYHRAGLPVRCAVGGRSISMRSYPGGLRQLASGWTKNIASGASAASPTASAATVAWVCAHHAVAAGVLLSLVAVAAGPRATDDIGAVLVWAAVWLLLALQMRAVLRRAGSFRWWTWALFPAPLLAFDIVFARSVIATALRRSVRWRGRSVDVRRPFSTVKET